MRGKRTKLASYGVVFAILLLIIPASLVAFLYVSWKQGQAGGHSLNATKPLLGCGTGNIRFGAAFTNFNGDGVYTKWVPEFQTLRHGTDHDVILSSAEEGRGIVVSFVLGNHPGGHSFTVVIPLPD